MVNEFYQRIIVRERTLVQFLDRIIIGQTILIRDNLSEQ